MSAAVEFAVRKCDGNRRVLVFIHGFSGDAHATFGMMPAFVAGDTELIGWNIFCFGYPTSLSPDITGVWSADPDLAALSAYFRQSLEQRFSQYSDIAIVAHSMGGLIVQQALIDGSFTDRVKHVFLFGTPSAGLRKAKLAKLFKRQARDMDPDCDFIRTLRERWDKTFAHPDFTLDVVAGLSDQFVPPRSSLDPFDESFRMRVLGNHLEIVKPSTLETDSVLVLLRRLKGVAPSPVVQTKSPPSQGVVEQALTLELLGREEEAIALLKQNLVVSTDVRGTLAGRYKRRWLRDPDAHEAEGRESERLYREAFDESRIKRDHEQAYYNGINSAFMCLAARGDRSEAAGIAQKVLEHTRQAPNSKWCSATEAEARLHLGEPAESIALYRNAMRGLDPRERSSMCQQAIWTARLLDESMVEAQLEALMLVGAP